MLKVRVMIGADVARAVLDFGLPFEDGSVAPPRTTPTSPATPTRSSGVRGTAPTKNRDVGMGYEGQPLESFVDALVAAGYTAPPAPGAQPRPAETLPGPSPRIAALNNLALASRAAGDPCHALDLTRTALALCASQGDRHREAALHSNLADLLHATGRQEEALAHLKQAAAIFAQIGGPEGHLHHEIWKLVEW
jgi:Tetratricopeptide repeat